MNIWNNKKSIPLRKLLVHQFFTGAFFLRSTFLLAVLTGAVLILTYSGKTVLAAPTPTSPQASVSLASESSVKAETASSPKQDSGIPPAVIIAILILPLLSMGLTIGTAVIIIQYKKSHPSLPPKDEKKPDSQKESNEDIKNPPV